MGSPLSQQSDIRESSVGWTAPSDGVLLTHGLSPSATTVIARVWRARAAPHLAPLYLSHFNSAVLPRLASLPGYRGAYLLQRTDADGVEFMVQTVWDSMDAVKGFAGPQPNVAVVDEEARAVLVSFDTVVQHYEVVVSPQ